MSRTSESAGTSPLVRPKRLYAQVAAAMVVLGVSAAIARDPLSTWEKELFKWMHDVPRWVDYIVWLPMQFGSAWTPVVAALVGYFVAKSWRPTVGALVAGWGGWWLAKVVKNIVERGRPYQEIGPANVRDTAVDEGLGFVSGHATVAFACAAILAPYLPRPWRWAVYGLAIFVSCSRIVVGAHLPLDAVGGACLGLALAWTWHLAVGIDASRART